MFIWLPRAWPPAATCPISRMKLLRATVASTGLVLKELWCKWKYSQTTRIYCPAGTLRVEGKSWKPSNLRLKAVPGEGTLFKCSEFHKLIECPVDTSIIIILLKKMKVNPYQQLAL
jgi:hypothetical protein